MPPACPAPPARRVRRLRLSATAEDDARHAETLLRDALGTVSLPGTDDGRHIVVRRLALGRVSARTSAAALALHIERVASAMWSEAVSYRLPAAATANIVVFPDRGRPIVALAGLLARGDPSNEWFWSAAVPGWSAGLSRAERWRVLLAAAHGLPSAPLVAAGVVDAAVSAGVEDALLGAVTPAETAAWCRLYGWSDAAPDTVAPPWSPARTADLERVLRRWPPDDDRVIWLTAMTRVSAAPALAADPRCRGHAARQLLDVWARLPRRLAEDAGHHRLAAAGAPAPPARREPADVRTERGDVAPPSAADMTSDRMPIRWKDVVDRGSDGDATQHAGLLFVIPILERLGFSAHVAAHPESIETAFGARLLLNIGARVGLPMDDPLASALRHTGVGAPAAELDDPAGVPGSVGMLLSSPPVRSPLSAPIDLWVAAVRRWSRRHARLGLRALVSRPGRVYASPTHLDIHFELAQLDVRIRRAALDVDPGWVPWLGRVVQFHYGVLLAAAFVMGSEVI